MTHRLTLTLLCMLMPIPLISGMASAADDQGETKDMTISAAGQKWHVSMHIPPQYDGKKPVPLVLILHGAGGEGWGYLLRAGWRDKANKAGFIAVAPDAMPSRMNLPAEFLTNPRIWNTGQLKPINPRSKIDDIAFIKALLAELQKQYKIDPHRIYLTGHSNGASMTFRVGAELADHFAAIAPVAGLCYVNDPKPSRPVPTLYIIGMQDKLVPVAGGESTTPWETRTTPPVSETLAKWAKAVDCETTPKPVSDKNGIKIVRYPSKKRGRADLTAYYIEGQGHNWPGGESMLTERIMGPSRSDFKATDVIWDFFSRHRLR